MLALVAVALLFVSVSAQSNEFTQGPFGFFGAGDHMWASSHCLDGSGSGSIFVTGYTEGTSLGQSSQLGGGDDWFIAKFNKNAGFLTINSSNPTLRFILSPASEQGFTCASDTAGAVYVGGGTTGSLTNVSRSNSQWESVVAKYDAQMNRVWLTQFDAGQSDFVVKVLLSGNVLYVIGQAQQNGYPNIYIHALNPNTGAELWTRPVRYGAQSGTYAAVADATVNLLTGDIVIVGRYYNTGPAGLMNSTGQIPPSLPSSFSYTNGFVASFTSSGVFNWHQAVGSTQYDALVSVDSDVSGSIFLGGFVSGRVNGADYLPASQSAVLPFLSKYSVNGEHQWSNILPNNDWQTISRVIADGVGGVFAIRSRADCFAYSSISDFYGRSLQCYFAYQVTSLIKANSANGAIQYIQPVSNGIPNSATLDRDGLLTIVGQIQGSNGNNLHGVAPPSSAWYTFIDQQQLSYNCSCDEMDSLINEMVQLLRLE